MAKVIVTASVEIHYPDSDVSPEERFDAAIGALGAHAETDKGALIVVKSSAFEEPAVQPVPEPVEGAVPDPFTEQSG